MHKIIERQENYMTSILEKRMSLSIWNQSFQKTTIVKMRFKQDSVGGENHKG